MTEFKNYKLEDFILNSSFCNYAKGLNDEDVRLWEEWMAHDNGNSQIALEAKAIIKYLKFKKENLPIGFINNEWNRLSNQLNESRRKTAFIDNLKQHLKIWHYAAAIVLVISVIVSIFLTNNLIHSTQQTAVTEIVVPFGQIKNILLPDSTLVFLNSGTRLSYNVNYGKRKREVYLKGEAYFDVIHNETKPFIVNTKDTKIKVLGTAFNVSAYENDNIEQISLIRGKVNIVQNDGTEAILIPDQNYLFIRNTKQSKIYKVENINNYISWKDGGIVFRNHRFFDIVFILERTHNKKIILSNKNFYDLRYTGVFSVNDDISKILNIIKLTTPLNYEVKNDTIIIR